MAGTSSSTISMPGTAPSKSPRLQPRQQHPDACAAPRVVAKGRFASKRKLSTLARAHNSHLWEQLFALPRLELDPDTLEAVRRTGINLDGMRCLRR